MQHGRRSECTTDLIQCTVPCKLLSHPLHFILVLLFSESSFRHRSSQGRHSNGILKIIERCRFYVRIIQITKVQSKTLIFSQKDGHGYGTTRVVLLSWRGFRLLELHLSTANCRKALLDSLRFGLRGRRWFIAGFRISVPHKIHCFPRNPRGCVGDFVDFFSGQHIVHPRSTCLNEKFRRSFKLQEKLQNYEHNRSSVNGEHGLTRSPQIVRLDQVRIVWRILKALLHVSVSAIFLMKFVFLSRREIPKLGTWNRSVVDLKRYGWGGCEVIVYATTLLRRNIR